MTPEELKNRSLRVTHQIEGTPSEEKDLIELDILQASENLEKYQQETTKWRDKKVMKKASQLETGSQKESQTLKPPANFNPSGRGHS